MPSGGVLVLAAVLGLGLYGGAYVVKQVDHGIHKVGHAIAHVVHPHKK